MKTHLLFFIILGSQNNNDSSWGIGRYFAYLKASSLTLDLDSKSEVLVIDLVGQEDNEHAAPMLARCLAVGIQIRTEPSLYAWDKQTSYSRKVLQRCLEKSSLESVSF